MLKRFSYSIFVGDIMAKIPSDKVAEIHEAARIEEVVGDFVALKKRGANMIGLCPFHNEKTPSFSVSPAKGIFKCFGCGEAGNAVNFVMKHEQYTYPEALKYLANKYNIEVKEEEETEEQRQAYDERESLMAVSSFAQKHFTKNLWESQEGRNVGLSYLKERGFLEKTIKDFQLGYSPVAWDDLTKAAKNSGYKEKYLEKSGLSIVKPNQTYDRFRNRVIFPIHNLSGKVIGFGGRILTNDKKKPKYLNSPESDIYNKSKILYGIYFSKGEIVKEDNCLMVEGYTDVISLHQSGIKNVVASSGTSLTVDQIRLVKRYTQNITILYDGDAAGLKASFRGIDLVLEQGMNVRVVLFPDGEDPDSFASSHSSEDTRTYLQKNAVDFIQFKSKLLFQENEHDPSARASAIEEIAKSIALIPNLLKRDEYIKETWESLGIDQQKLSYRVSNLRNKSKNQQELTHERQAIAQAKIPLPEENKIFEEKNVTQDELIRVLVLYGRFLTTYVDSEGELHNISVSEFIINELMVLDFRFADELNQQIYTRFVENLESKYIPDEKIFLKDNNPKITQRIINLIAEKNTLSENWELQKGIFTTKETDVVKQLIDSLLWDNETRIIESRLKALNNKLKNPGEDDLMKILEEYSQLKQKQAEIHKKRGIIINK